MPRRGEVEFRQRQRPPARERRLHEVLARQGDRQIGMLAAGVDQDRRRARPVGIGELARVLGGRDRGVEPRHLAADHLGVAMRLHRVGERPQHRVHRIGVDVRIDGDEDLAERGIEAAAARSAWPGLAELRPVELDDEHHVAARHLVACHPGHRGDVARAPEVVEIDRVERGLANHRALARRELADDPLIDRRGAVADGRDLQHLLHLARPR